MERVRAIVEKLRARASLLGGRRRASQLDRLRVALENIPLGLCMFDPSGRIVVNNRRYAEIIDIPAERVRPGAHLRDLLQYSIEMGHFPGKTPEEVERQLWPPLEPGSERHRVFQRNGRDFAITQRVTENGFRVAAFEEVTEKLAAEAAMRDGEARLSAILDAMPDCVKIFDEAGTLTYINPAGLELLQAPDFESLGRPGYVPVPPEYLDSCIATHQRVIAGQPTVNNYEVLGLQGRRRHVEAHAVPLPMPDGSRAHLCISRDTTERKEAETTLQLASERLQLVHEATGLAQFETFADGVAVVSDRLLDQVGLPRGDNRIPFDKWLEIVHPADRDLFRNLVASSSKETIEFQSEFRIVRRELELALIPAVRVEALVRDARHFRLRCERHLDLVRPLRTVLRHLAGARLVERELPLAVQVQPVLAHQLRPRIFELIHAFPCLSFYLCESSGISTLPLRWPAL